jgi:hypothetical protein
MKVNYTMYAAVFLIDLKDMYTKNDAGVIRSTPFGNNLWPSLP